VTSDSNCLNIRNLSDNLKIHRHILCQAHP
jgi:hypothetical protein